MERSDLQSAVLEVLVRVLKVPRDIAPSASLTDHGLTSLRSVSLVVAIEDEFDITFEDQRLDLGNFTSVDRIVDLVEPLMKAEEKP